MHFVHAFSFSRYFCFSTVFQSIVKFTPPSSSAVNCRKRLLPPLHSLQGFGSINRQIHFTVITAVNYRVNCRYLRHSLPLGLWFK